MPWESFALPGDAAADAKANEGLGDVYEHLTPAENEACLNAHLDLIDYNIVALPQMANAWGRGDLATVLRVYREIGSSCIPASLRPNKARANAEFTDRTARELDAALSKPGKSIAILPFPLLMQKDGILDRLAAKGVDVIAPAAVEDMQ